MFGFAAVTCTHPHETESNSSSIRQWQPLIPRLLLTPISTVALERMAGHQMMPPEPINTCVSQSLSQSVGRSARGEDCAGGWRGPTTHLDPQVVLRQQVVAAGRRCIQSEGRVAYDRHVHSAGRGRHPDLQEAQART